MNTSTSTPTCKSCNNQLEAKRADNSAGKVTICGFCAVIGKYDTQANIIPFSENELRGYMQNKPEDFRFMLKGQSIVRAALKQQNAPSA